MFNLTYFIYTFLYHSHFSEGWIFFQKVVFIFNQFQAGLFLNTTNRDLQIVHEKHAF